MSCFPGGDCSPTIPYVYPQKKDASNFPAAAAKPGFVGRFLVLLSPHSSAVEERRDGHANHDANGDADATKHGGSNARSKSIHGIILRKLRYFPHQQELHVRDKQIFGQMFVTQLEVGVKLESSKHVF